MIRQSNRARFCRWFRPSLQRLEGREAPALFGPFTTLNTANNPYAVAVGDLNADGKQDLVAANYGNNNIQVFFGSGNGGFVSAGSPTAVGNFPYPVAVADFNRDGRQDVTRPAPGP